MSCRNTVGMCVMVCLVLASARILCAQSLPGGFREFIDRLPAAATAPPDAELVKLDPNRIDAGDDISTAEHRLSERFDVMRGKHLKQSANQSGTTANVQPAMSAVHTADQAIDERVVGEPLSVTSLTEDSCVRLGHRLHDLEFRFSKTLEALDTTYVTRVNTAHAHANAIERNEPCNGNIGCIKRHRSERDLALAAAERIRITERVHILAAQVRELAPMLTSVDAAIPPKLWKVENEHFRRNLEELGDQALRLSITLAEQIKLNRVYLSNCCKLLLEANDR